MLLSLFHRCPSFVCTKKADLSNVTNQVYPLVYFCSRHTNEWRESRANAVGLLEA